MKISDYLMLTKNLLAAYNRICEPLLLKHDIPQVSFDILMFLTNNPELCTAQDISDYRNIKKNLVSVHVEKLVNSGYLERGDFSGDRRKISLRTTGKALAIIEEGLLLQKTFFEKLKADIPEEDWLTYIRVSEKIAENRKNL